MSFFAKKVESFPPFGRLIKRQATFEPFGRPVKMPETRSTVEQHIELEGTILAVLAGTMFRVALNNQHQVLAHISGKMRKRFVRLTIGDRVRMEMSPYDLSKARIVYRVG